MRQSFPITLVFDLKDGYSVRILIRSTVSSSVQSVWYRMLITRSCLFWKCLYLEWENESQQVNPKSAIITSGNILLLIFARKSGDETTAFSPGKWVKCALEKKGTCIRRTPSFPGAGSKETPRFLLLKLLTLKLWSWRREEQEKKSSEERMWVASDLFEKQTAVRLHSRLQSKQHLVTFVTRNFYMLSSETFCSHNRTTSTNRRKHSHLKPSNDVFLQTHLTRDILLLFSQPNPAFFAVFPFVLFVRDLMFHCFCNSWLIISRD